MSELNTAVILAGGVGRRLMPFTTTIPKPLFPVGNKPIIQIIIEQLKAIGITEFIISLGHLGGLIQAYLGDGGSFECRISYIQEKEPLGTAGAISLLPSMPDNFIFMNGDVLTSMDFRAAISFHLANRALTTVCAYVKKVKSSLGILEVNGSNSIVNYSEKPETQYLVSTGIYIMNCRVNRYVQNNEKIDLPDLILRLVKQDQIVKSYVIKGDWYDIGTPEDLSNALDFYENSIRK